MKLPERCKYLGVWFWLWLRHSAVWDSSVSCLWLRWSSYESYLIVLRLRRQKSRGLWVALVLSTWLSRKTYMPWLGSWALNWLFWFNSWALWARLKFEVTLLLSDTASIFTASFVSRLLTLKSKKLEDAKFIPVGAFVLSTEVNGLTGSTLIGWISELVTDWKGRFSRRELMFIFGGACTKGDILVEVTAVEGLLSSALWSWATGSVQEFKFPFFDFAT